MAFNAKTFFLGKTKTGRILSIPTYFILTYILFVAFCPHPFFSEKYEIGSCVFYSNENTKEFRAVCDEIEAQITTLPVYNSNKKIHYFFTDSLSLYRALSVTSMNSLGHTLAFGGFYRVVFAPSNFLNKTITSGAKQNNVHNIVSAAVHESVHCYLTKGAILLNRVRMPLWIEEGVCEYLAKDSSYNIHQGMENILNEVTDPAKSFNYFVWRTAVVYLIEIKGLTLNDVLKYKEKPAPVITEFKTWYQNSETEQKTQFISLLE